MLHMEWKVIDIHGYAMEMMGESMTHGMCGIHICGYVKYTMLNGMPMNICGYTWNVKGIKRSWLFHGC